MLRHQILFRLFSMAQAVLTTAQADADTTHDPSRLDILQDKNRLPPRCQLFKALAPCGIV